MTTDLAMIMTKPVATLINFSIAWALSAPMSVISFEAWKRTAVVVLFIYSASMDILFGRCIGMMIAGTHWIGTPDAVHKLIYSAAYTGGFVLLFHSFKTAALITSAQVVSVLTTGTTTHGLIAGMCSEPLGG